ncbi:MAG: GMC family oxidoreductase [bacterium]|nr:GMC family oxidoreductase [bacterium]
MSEVDVCIVGAGAGGAVAAWALTQRGIRVRLLETGPRFDPEHYRTHDRDWEVHFTRFAEEASAERYSSYESSSGQDLDPRYAHLASNTPSTFVRPRSFRRRRFIYSRAQGVGGSTLHYQGEAHRFPPHSFRMHSERGVAVDWPVTYEMLAPYYERMEVLLGVAGDPNNSFKAARGPYPFPAHPISDASQQVQEAAQRLGWNHLSNPLAVLRRAQNARSACHYCNGCSRGCMVGAKGSVDVAVVPEALRSGKLELVTGFHASRLELDAEGHVTGVIGFDEQGVEQRHRAKAIVLATGAIETPRLLLNSVGPSSPNGVGNEQGQVGLHLMEHLYFRVAAVSDRTFEPAGLPIDSRIWDFNAGNDEVAAGFVLGQEVGNFEGPAGFALEGATGFGSKHREAMRRFRSGIELMSVAEQLPRTENRVSLSRENDSFGSPLAHVDTKLDEADLAILDTMHRKLHELIDAMGNTRKVGQYGAYDAPYATHVAGTCRFGGDPRSSVCDAEGAIHGHPNLVLADASVLPTQGAGDSPSLTIQALALRAAERLAQRLGSG